MIGYNHDLTSSYYRPNDMLTDQGEERISHVHLSYRVAT